MKLRKHRWALMGADVDRYIYRCVYCPWVTYLWREDFRGLMAGLPMVRPPMNTGCLRK